VFYKAIFFTFALNPDDFFGIPATMWLVILPLCAGISSGRCCSPAVRYAGPAQDDQR